MYPNTLEEIKATFDASNEGRLHFGEVVRRLSSANVEAYLVDYRAGRSCYYLSGDQTVDLAFETEVHSVADAFDSDAVKSAIHLAQRGEARYPEFKRLSKDAGCIGYMVWIAGRQVTYFGRRGETHVERFPN